MWKHALLSRLFCSLVDWEYNNIILEGDAQNVILTLKKKGYNGLTIGNLIFDTHVLVSNLSRLDYSLVRRNGNDVTHRLACQARVLDGFRVWMSVMPSFICDALSADVCN